MTHKTQRSASGRPTDKRALLRRWLPIQETDPEQEMDLSWDTLQEMEIDLTETESEKNGRPKHKKWVLIH